MTDLKNFDANTYNFNFDTDLLTGDLMFVKLTFRIIATVTLVVRKMHFVKLGSPKNGTDAFAKTGTRALVATKVISMETKLEECSSTLEEHNR